MARSRNIKPGFFSNDTLAELPALTRLLFIGLWTICDREGRLEDRPRKIKAEALPYDDHDVDAALTALHQSGFILRYVSGGVRCIQVVNWAKHQNPHMKEAESSIPAPDEHQTSTVQAPDEQQPKPERAGLIPDSLNLIPDSGFPSRAEAPQAIAKPEKPAPPENSAARGTRLPLDWSLPAKWESEAMAIQPTWGAQRCQQVADVFRDYWVAKPGQSGVKTDWLATWRNWVRKESADQRAPPNGKTAKQREAEAFMRSIGGGSDGNDSNGNTIDGTAERVADHGDRAAVPAVHDGLRQR